MVQDTCARPKKLGSPCTGSLGREFNFPRQQLFRLRVNISAHTAEEVPTAEGRTATIIARGGTTTPKSGISCTYMKQQAAHSLDYSQCNSHPHTANGQSDPAKNSSVSTTSLAVYSIKRACLLHRRSVLYTVDYVWLICHEKKCVLLSKPVHHSATVCMIKTWLLLLCRTSNNE